MIRGLLVTGLLTVGGVTANAAPLLGDFECVSDRQGPETYEGTLRIEEPTSFGFLTQAATVDAWFPLDLSNPDDVKFDDAFTEHISFGAVVQGARMLEDEFAYAVEVRTKKGDIIPVYCLFIY